MNFSKWLGTSQKFRMVLTLCFLTLVTVLSFAKRLDNFNSHLKTHRVSIDENVFFSIARQLQENPLAYNARGYVARRQSPQELPGYMSEPLFKHPPLFSYLLLLSLTLFAKMKSSVIFVPLFFGCLTVPLTYLLSRTVCHRRASLLAAMIMAQDPVSIICSQKVWLASTLTFFAALAVYLYIKGEQARKGTLFLWGGFSIGLATLTKYPGILTLSAVILYAAVYNRKLFRNRWFLHSLYIPLLMLVPWSLWNFKVYGSGLFKKFFGWHGLFVSNGSAFSVLLFILTVSGMVIYALRQRNRTMPALVCFFKKRVSLFRSAAAILLGIILFKPLVQGMSFSDFPAVTWASADLPRSDGWLFYLRKLVEYSLLYILAYGSFLVTSARHPRFLPVMKINAGLYFVFYTVYGNYQSRYIAMALPFLIILAAYVWYDVFERIKAVPDGRARWGGLVLWSVLLVWSFVKTLFININVSFLNDMCYF